MKNIFVELEGVLATPQQSEVYTVDAIRQYKQNHDTVDLVRTLSKSYNIVVFSYSKEDCRLAVEDWICEHNLDVDEVLLRGEHDFLGGLQSRIKMIENYYNFDENKRILKTVAVFTNHEKTIETLRDEEMTVIQTGW